MSFNLIRFSRQSRQWRQLALESDTGTIGTLVRIGWLCHQIDWHCIPDWLALSSDWMALESGTITTEIRQTRLSALTAIWEQKR